MARAAAFEDPRFPPVGIEEWPSVTIEVSVLGPMERLASAGDLVVGRHGLYIVQGFRAGVLLPQVATEWGWDRDEFPAASLPQGGAASRRLEGPDRGTLSIRSRGVR
ncbi:MAG: AMMECR1 family protein [Desulfomicrobium escambiense]|nr:AMMECR1 family protein [Desulfomicrobium escambiense]